MQALHIAPRATAYPADAPATPMAAPTSAYEAFHIIRRNGAVVPFEPN